MVPVRKYLTQQVCISEAPRWSWFGRLGGCIFGNLFRSVSPCHADGIERFPGLGRAVEGGVAHRVYGRVGGDGWLGGCGVLLRGFFFASLLGSLGGVRSWVGLCWGVGGNFVEKVPERRPARRTAPGEHLKTQCTTCGWTVVSGITQPSSLVCTLCNLQF